VNLDSLVSEILRQRKRLPFAFVAASALLSCSGHVTTGTSGSNCSEDAQCAAGNVCANQHCTPTNDAGSPSGAGTSGGGARSSGGGASHAGGASSNGGTAGSEGGIAGAVGAGGGGAAADASTGGAGGAFSGKPGEIGDVFVPEDESRSTFSGYSISEVNISTRFAVCASGVGIVAHFQGRVGCPYGQPADPQDPTRVDPAHQACFTPSGEPVTVPVAPQYVGRPPGDYIYCSCRCDGPLKGKEIYCACPDGFACEPLLPAYGSPDDDLYAGSYCQKPGTLPSQDAGAVCSRELVNCGPL
jgi:hypothetical protein